MDILDVIIAVLAIVVAVSGYRRGMSWVGMSIIGLLLGIVIGALITPPIARAIAPQRPGQTSNQALVAAGVFVATVLLIQGAGTALGFRARVKTLRTRFAEWDSVAGSIIAVVGILATSWYVGLTFSNSPWTGVNDQIQGSAVIRALDTIFPTPPGFLLKLQQVFRNSQLPNAFAAIGGGDLPPQPLPASINTPGVRDATAEVSRVIAYDACPGSAEAGSAWPIGDQTLVTNAHVVAGSDRVEVDAPGGQTFKATVVLYDPNTDVAVLRVPGLHQTPLTLYGQQDPPVGTSGAVIGYPGGGGEQTVPAAVRGTEDAQGYNIYNDQVVTRSIVVLSAVVIPGNSGGPVVDLDGHVMGLVFAASTTHSGEGYALSISQITADLDAGRSSTQPVSTGQPVNC